MTAPHVSSRALAIFCHSLRLKEDPISDEYFWDAYQDLMLAIKQRGVEPYLVSDNATYKGSGVFASALAIERKVALPRLLPHVKNVQVDFVMERSEPDPFRYHDIPVLNDDMLRRIINNKISIYEHFPEFQPHSAVAHDREELVVAVTQLDGDRAVVKIEDGYGGNGVYIGSKSEVLSQTTDIVFPVLVQEFLDTSAGIPGQTKGVHDIRTKVCEGTIISYSTRVARPGSYHSNISQGGTQITLPLSALPSEISQMVREIDAKLPQLPRFYSADFAYSDKGCKLIELNDYVGLTAAVDGPEAIDSINRLADYLVSICNRPQTLVKSAGAHT